jgi:predicted peptidase
VEGSKEMVQAVKDCGGNARLTVYPDAGHDSWIETYNNQELYDWFLKHRRVISDAKAGDF